MFSKVIWAIRDKREKCFDIDGKVTEQFEEKINYWAEELGLRCEAIGKEGRKTYKGFSAKKGTKASKLIQKLATMCGIDKHKDIRETRFIADNGREIVRTKDYGWNMQYAPFADAVTPKTVKGTLVISANPLDYWTMSFGLYWASCHTIDKYNIRIGNGAHSYSGCYCGGTSSYMLDKHTLIAYTLKGDWQGDFPEKEDKITRCVISIGNDFIYQGRLYPNGRDGGDQSIQIMVRHAVQKVVSELFDIPNMWVVEKGTRACSSVLTTNGVQYEDYHHYGDCNISFNKRINGYINRNPITIGHPPICPECGETHWFEENVFCEDCASEMVCDNCGDRIRWEDSYDFGDRHYCRDCVSLCERCGDALDPEGDDMHETNDADCVCRWCISRRYTWSDYDDIFVNNNDVIETAEGNFYREDSDGYGICDSCGEYHDERELIYDEVTGNCYCEVCYDRIMAERNAAENNGEEE